MKPAGSADSITVAALGTVTDDEARLAALGYKQQLKRDLSLFTNFALSFTIVSILTGLTGLYGLGFVYGGPVVIIWGWVISVTLTLAVGASMGEIVSAYPTSGGMYFSSYMLAPPRWRAFAAWTTGWFNLLGQAAVTAGIDFTLTNTLIAMISLATGGINGGGWAPEPPHVLGIYAAMLVSHGLFNTFSIRVLSVVDGISAVWHVLGTVAFMIILLAVAPTRQPASWVFGHFDPAPDSGIKSPVYVFLLGLLMSMFTLTGYDASAHVSEESRGAARTAPRAIILCISVSGVVGLLYLLAITFSIQDPTTLLDTSNATGGTAIVVQVVYDAFSARFGAPAPASAVGLMVIPLVAQYFCGLASVTANSRTLFAFSRDGAVPGFKLWSWVSPRNRTPIAATWAMVLAAFILGLPMLGSIVAFTAVTSIATIGLYISYAIPILLRVTAARKSFEPGPWNLGRFGVPIGTVAVLWVAFLTVLFVLPTAYPVTALNFNYASAAVGFVLVFCLGYWLLSARRWYDGPHTRCRLPDAQAAAKVVAKA